MKLFMIWGWTLVSKFAQHEAVYDLGLDTSLQICPTGMIRPERIEGD